MFKQNIALNLLQYLLVDYWGVWAFSEHMIGQKCRMSHHLFWSVLPDKNVNLKCVSKKSDFSQLLEVH